MTINELLYKLENPQVYTGLELNAVHKPVQQIRNGDLINICLVFPDKYEIGMSHHGLIILYHMLNNMDHVNAERCFLPSKGSIKTFIENDVPLFSLESKTPLKQFDLIGFSLLSEMTYTNVLQVLDLAQIPLFSHQRGDRTYPVIAAGGISAVNPEPLRDFVDIFGIGDGEDLFPDIIEALQHSRQKGEDRDGLLKRFSSIQGIYVPVLNPVELKGRFLVPKMKTGNVKKRIKRNLDEGWLDKETALIMPITNAIFDRLTIEIARGCPQNCRFCQAKSYYSPFRARSLENNLKTIAEGLKATGFESFSLSSLSTGDYPFLTRLLEEVPELITPGVSFSLPSLRPSTLSERMLSTLALFRRTGLTIVPEAGTPRLRNVINKDVTDEEIYSAVELALRNKWQKIKLYFMLGLPTETMEDIDGIVDMILKIKEMASAKKQRIKIHASFSSFVPKAQTPLQWARREGGEEIFKKVNHIKSRLKFANRYSLDLDFHLPFKGVAETVLSRGDARVGQFLLNVYKKGEIFSGWDSDFNFSTWKEEIDGTVYEEFLGELSLEEPLPWDGLQINFKKEYMQEEYKKALTAVPTDACHHMECKTCRGCNFIPSTQPAVKSEENPKEVSSKKVNREEVNREEVNREDVNRVAAPADPAKREPQFRKIRIVYEKTGQFIFFSHLSMMKYIERLLRRTGIKFKCSQGFNRRMKITTLPALPVFATGKQEVAEVFLDDSFCQEKILEQLNAGAPDYFQFKEVIDSSEFSALNKDIHFLDFELTLHEPVQYKEMLEPLLAETDSITFEENRLLLTMDYSKQGQERFAKLYKTIDPEKENTRCLTRTSVTFKSSTQQGA